MLRQLATRLIPHRVVHAHCDIPCGLYDPHEAQLAAQTVETMVTKIKGLPDDGSEARRNSFVRMVTVKEQHAERVKHEVQILWSDYFKPEHLEKFPELHDLVWKTLKAASACKQNVDAEKAAELRTKVDEVARIFHETKR
ncbi:MAG: superoxide dismutase, Ni [Candidatus Dormibacteria bacterium]